MRNIKQTFIEKLHECNQHKKRLLKAKSYLKDIMPLDIDRYNTLNEVQMSFIDQMIFRFSKLQDTMGEKIFPNILELFGEDIKKLTFIDRLNRLEELELLYKDEWMSLRKDRNEIAHEYSFNQDEVVNGINLIFDRTDDLLKIYQDIYRYCFEKFEFVKESKILE
ncbi:hypothetical protein RZR97_07800 [Hydrogenimonas thermophila]|uniref:hypothetical protein n=1 Tax=Hydrogenimonas thermophila TaxID=223786 RepID=UPI002937244E|nr:hypothetical protein [Hydrogenimonas thermophila]WOE69013.1 hypothetical protein RZR91_07820 [Hydrogenimonas thermophila]WOE71524.1 hypothetical protein RZR97_07800 [Hydrogenimonas thermophila]